MRVMALLIVVLGLSACGFGQFNEPGQSAERNIARDLSELFDGIDVGPAANCVRDNATGPELAILSRDDVATAPLTQQIFERPQTLTCLQANGVIEVLDIVEVVQ